MTPEQMRAHIAALSAQIDRQADTIKALWVRQTRLRKERDFWKRLALEREQPKRPTWLEQAIADAEAVFKRGAMK